MFLSIYHNKIFQLKKNDKVIIGLCFDSPDNDEDKSNMLYGNIYKAVGMKDCIVMGHFNR